MIQRDDRPVLGWQRDGAANLRTSALGRANGIAYFALVGLCIFSQLPPGNPLPINWLIAAGWLLVATTAVSMLDRLWTLTVAGGRP